MIQIINEILNAPVPTRLLVGQLEKLQDLAELAIRSEFCEQKNIEQVENCFCIQCRKIKNRQHPFLVWINPEKNYSVDDVQIIFDCTKFALESNQKFFFVLDKASELNAATANKLLKILEEPCEGYKFILLADNINRLPATIISRSHIIKITNDKQQQEENPLIKLFTTPDKLPDPITFDQEIKKASLSEQECVELCYELIEYFLAKNKKENNDRYKNKLEILQKRLRKPPCPGSSSLFLKLLYLDLRHNT